MTAARIFSLAHLTVLDLAPPEMIRVAAAAGYDAVGLRLRPATANERVYDLAADPALARETVAALGETGLRVLDVEIVRLVPDFAAAAFAPMLELAERLGARHVLVAGNDPDRGRAAESLAALAGLAATHGLTVDLEPMPWTDAPNVATAAAIVAASGAANAGVLVDALHFDRSASTLADLAAVPAARFHYVQLCDGPAERPRDLEGLLHAARAERLPPGEGGIDLSAILRALPAGIPVSLEIPQRRKAALMPAVERIRHDLAAARAVVAAA